MIDRRALHEPYEQPYARSAPSSPPPLLPRQSPGAKGGQAVFFVVLYQRILASISGPVFIHADPISGPHAGTYASSAMARAWPSTRGLSPVLQKLPRELLRPTLQEPLHSLHRARYRRVRQARGSAGDSVDRLCLDPIDRKRCDREACKDSCRHEQSDSMQHDML